MTFELIILGLFVGAVTGLTGASGILIMVPVLTTFFVFPLPVILGTSLLVDVIASLSVAYAYYKNKQLETRGVLWLIVGSLIGAQVGSFFVVQISRILIMAVLGACMIVFGLRVWRNGSLDRKHKAIQLPEKLSTPLRTPIGLVLCGLVIGLTTGIFGAGGGLTIFIVLYSLLDFPIKKAVGTSTFIMMTTALSGVIGYYDNGNLDITLGLTIGISAAVGGLMTSFFANKLNDRILSKIIGAFFVFLAIIMLGLKVIAPLITRYLL